MELQPSAASFLGDCRVKYQQAHSYGEIPGEPDTSSKMDDAVLYTRMISSDESFHLLVEQTSSNGREIIRPGVFRRTVTLF